MHLSRSSTTALAEFADTPHALAKSKDIKRAWVAETQRIKNRAKPLICLDLRSQTEILH
ncbi:hypothetical protein BN2475_10002 [Paraburkholderia ribeironis]|uniref:Uncharacterized protein n=1 Tax=Paraburkholderia ribeironis TaxID=1247936 RepID=A0A1N7RI61_9BURK|nr:hypothetical protein BN2475_10002 [Paraburkholderia ribeironis]